MEETRMQSSPTSIGRQFHKVLVIADLQKVFLKRSGDYGTTDHRTTGPRGRKAGMGKTANRSKRRDASAVAGLACLGGLAGKALQLRVFALLLFILPFKG